MARTTEQLHLRVDPHVKRDLEQRAADEGVSVNKVAETGLILFLAALLPNDQENTLHE